MVRHKIGLTINPTRIRTELRSIGFAQQTRQLTNKMGESSAVSDTIIQLRQKVCPRTSYTSGGTAASVLFVVYSPNCSSHLRELSTSILNSIINVKEFDETREFESIESMLEELSGHVFVVVGNFPDASIEAVTNSITGRKATLGFHALDIPSEEMKGEDEEEESDDDIMFDRSRNSRKRKFASLATTEKDFVSLKVRLQTWHLPTRKSVRDAKDAQFTGLSYAFNGQPISASRRQFLFLWGMLPETLANATPEEQADLLDGKRRVLQRLASKASVVDRSRISDADWDRLITHALQVNQMIDPGIYSLIRERVLGKTLQESLRQDTAAAGVMAGVSTDNSGGSAADDEEDRSEHLVTATLECLGDAVLLNPQHSVRSLLDYGCAEGAITATLGKKLQLPRDKIFGADVRSITSRDFTYIQLAAEDPQRPPLPGTILPQLADHSISLINCAMVLHHVIHPEAIIKEFRRVIANNGALVIREHDCRNRGTAAFLDILHGLYSLAWKDPIEWPAFINEYAAFYRSREEWNDLMTRNGFNLRAKLPKAYTAAENSVYRNGRFPNVTRAYYAVYIPDFSTRVPPSISSTAMAASKQTNTASASSSSSLGANAAVPIANQAPKGKAKGKAGAATTSSSAASKKGEGDKVHKCTPAEIIAAAAEAARAEYTLCESQSQPGRYYKFYPANGKTEWLYFS